MKLMILQRTMSQRPGLAWDSPEIRHLDQIYSSLGPDGLYWAYEKAGLAEHLVADELVEHFSNEPPSDSRAWTRAMLLRAAPPDWLDSVDWDSISFRVRDGGYWPRIRSIDMENPLALTAAETAEYFPPSGRFSDLLDAIESAAGQRPEPVTQASRPASGVPSGIPTVN
jgi:proteasome accessory factor A